MKPIKFSIVFTLFFLNLISCAPKEKETLPVSNELTRMSAEERQQKAPNEAFEAVYLKDIERVKELLDSNLSLFYPANKEGLTPLMVAMSLRQKEISEVITDSLSLSDLYHTDKDGRGYVSYAAQQSYISIVDIIAEKYKSKLQFYNLYFFSEMDFPDKNGKTALFYASTGAMAQRLKEHWLHGHVSFALSATWWSDFYQARDNEGQSFIHWAAINNKHDVLRWATKELCGPAPFEESDWLLGLVHHLGQGVDWAASALQTAPFLIPKDLINLQSNSGQSALHWAAQLGHDQAATALMSCRYTDYGLVNVFGRNPLSELLAFTDKHQNPVDTSRKKLFDSLYQKVNKTWQWISSSEHFINQEDYEGQTSLHHAALLKDPYFYNKLKVIGNIHQQDDARRTPEGIFKSKSQP